MLLVSPTESSKVDPQGSSAFSNTHRPEKSEADGSKGISVPSDCNHKMMVGTCDCLATHRSCEDHASCSQCGCGSKSIETLLDDDNTIRSSGVHCGPRINSQFGALGRGSEEQRRVMSMAFPYISLVENSSQGIYTAY